MRNKYERAKQTVNIDVDLDAVLAEIDDSDLIEEIKSRGLMAKVLSKDERKANLCKSLGLNEFATLEDIIEVITPLF